MERRKEDDTLRSLSSFDGSIDFLSNDYLGFATDEHLFSKTFQLLLKEGIASNGSTGSRLLSGNHTLYGRLEADLTTFYKTEATLVFNSGYDANMGFFSAVPQRGDFIFYDEYIHASIREGIRMSNAKGYSFLHNNLANLEQRIQTITAKTEDGEQGEIYVVTESVFSMDGDSPNLTDLVKITTKNGYHLVVDEAHAVGIFGTNGEGMVPAMGLEKDVFARTVTFGKAFGCHGAAILGSTALKEYLVNFAKSLIYTTALPPHTLATMITAHSYFRESGLEHTKKLKENIGFFNVQLIAHKLSSHFIVNETPIQSCRVPGAKKAKSVSQKLRDKGFNVKAICAPTVPEGKERLRFCIHSYNSKEEIGLLMNLLVNHL